MNNVLAVRTDGVQRKMESLSLVLVIFLWLDETTWVTGRWSSVTEKKVGVARREMLTYNSCFLYQIKKRLSRPCFSRTVK